MNKKIVAAVLLVIMVVGIAYYYAEPLTHEVRTTGFAGVFIIPTELKPLEAWLVFRLPSGVCSWGDPYCIPYAREQELSIETLPAGGYGFVTQPIPAIPLNVTSVQNMLYSSNWNGKLDPPISTSHDTGCLSKYYVLMAFTQAEVSFLTQGWVPQGGVPKLHVYSICTSTTSFESGDDFTVLAYLTDYASGEDH